MTKSSLSASIDEFTTLGVTEINLYHLTAEKNGATYSAEYLSVLMNWYPKYRRLIQNLAQPSNQMRLVKFITNYFSCTDLEFLGSYGLPRSEAPFIIICTLIDKEHYRLHLNGTGLTLVLSETAYSGDPAYNEYKSLMFIDACPEHVVIKWPSDAEQNSILLPMTDDVISADFCHMIKNANVLTLGELKELEGVLYEMAAKDHVKRDDAIHIAKVVKTALAFELYEINKIYVGNAQDCDVLTICLDCLKGFGFKSISKFKCH